MKSIILGMLFAAALVNARPKRSHDTDISVCSKTIQIGNTYYLKEPLVSLHGFPADVAIDWNTGNIFFTYIHTDLTMKLHVVKKGSKKEEMIRGYLGNGQSSAIDQTNGVVYLATDKGLYTYNNDKTSAEYFGADKADIMYMDVADKGKTIYYVIWQGHKVFKMKADKSKTDEIPAIPNGHGLAVDSKDNLFYVVEKVAYMLRNGESEGARIKNLPVDSVADFFVDKHDTVWAINDDGTLYRIHSEENKAEMVGKVGYESVNTFGFDADDNIVIGVQNGLALLEKMESNPCP